MNKPTIDWTRFGPIPISLELDRALRSSVHNNGHIDNCEDEWREEGKKSDLAITELENVYLATKKARMGL